MRVLVLMLACVVSALCSVLVVAGEAAPVVEELSWLARFLEVVPDWIEAAGLLVAFFAFIAPMTPTPKDDSVVSWLQRIVHWLAMNFGHAANRGAPGAASINRQGFH